MLQVVVQLHFYNMVLVLAAGLIAGVWGLVLFFRERRSSSADKRKDADPASSPREAARSGGEGKEDRAVDLPRRTLNRPWRISLIVTAVLGALQALLGITLVLLGQRAPGGIFITCTTSMVALWRWLSPLPSVTPRAKRTCAGTY